MSLEQRLIEEGPGLAAALRERIRAPAQFGGDVLAERGAPPHLAHGGRDAHVEELREGRVRAHGQVLALERFEVGDLREQPEEDVARHQPVRVCQAMRREPPPAALDVGALCVGRGRGGAISLAQRLLRLGREAAHGEVEQPQKLDRRAVDRAAERGLEFRRLDQQALEKHLGEHAVERQELVPSISDENLFVW